MKEFETNLRPASRRASTELLPYSVSRITIPDIEVIMQEDESHRKRRGRNRLLACAGVCVIIGEAAPTIAIESKSVQDTP